MKYRLIWLLTVCFVYVPKYIFIDSWRWVITGKLLAEDYLDKKMNFLWDKFQKGGKL